MSHTDPASDVRVLAAYLTPHLAGARVLYIGDLDDAGPLFDAGARLVHAYRFTRPPRPLSGPVLVQNLERGLNLPTGGFDLAIVEDLGKVSTRLDLLSALRNALGSRGIAALVARTTPAAGGPAEPGTLDYTKLYDACATYFEHVKMVGKLPFTGTLLCELGLDAEPEVSVDTELAQLPAPSTLVALVSQRPIEVDEYAIFAHPLAEAKAPLQSPVDAAELSRLTLQNQVLQAQLLEAKEARAQASGLQRELESAIASTATARREALDLRNALEAALAQQAELAAEDEDLDKTLAELALQSERAEQSEARAAASEAQVERLQAELRAAQTHVTESRHSAERAERLAAAATVRAERAEERATKAEHHAQQAEHHITQSDGRLESLKDQLERALAKPEPAPVREVPEVPEVRPEPVQAAPAESFEDELLVLEERLRERGAVILELQAELARKDRMVLQLVLAERLGGGAQAGSDLEQKLDQLAREAARRQGELEARGWRIQELESALAESMKTPESLG